MNKPVFKVIEGGLTSVKKRKKHFISAYATNTRLMGVLAVYARWHVEGEDELDLHQFFYIDCEEAGLETYKSILGNDTEAIAAIEQALIGGLGAEKVSLSQRQLCGLLCMYKRFNEEHSLPLPADEEEYRFVLEPETVLDKSDYDTLMDLICDEITSNYQLVNYFLMRCFGGDRETASRLAAGGTDIDIYSNYKKTTFCKNVIDKDKTYDDGAVSYMCESLVESRGNYETVISRIVAKDLKVVHAEHCSGFKVSQAEAAMMLAKPEFVTVYEVLLSEEEMDNNIGEFTVSFNTIMSIHENGRLFMAYRKNNDHVGKRIFRLSNDVKGVYYLTDFGQLIAAAYSLRDIISMENMLKSSPLGPFLIPASKYEFKEPVLFEFMQSDFEDFEEFLSFIKDE